jgi:hypothetical protein
MDDFGQHLHTGAHRPILRKKTLPQLLLDCSAPPASRLAAHRPERLMTPTLVPELLYPS